MSKMFRLPTEPFALNFFIYFNLDNQRARRGSDNFLQLIQNNPAHNVVGIDDDRWKQTAYRYLWLGDQMVEETPIYADGTLAYDSQIQWLYHPRAITPAARYQNGDLKDRKVENLGADEVAVDEDTNIYCCGGYQPRSTGL